MPGGNAPGEGFLGPSFQGLASANEKALARVNEAALAARFGVERKSQELVLDL